MKQATGPEVCRAPERAGWHLARIRGAHFIYKKSGVRRPIPVPVHGNATIPTGTLKNILRESGLTDDDL